MSGAVTAVEGIAAPLDASNVDTDQIIPARYLLRPRDAGYGPLLFRNLRFTPDGAERPDFVLNRPVFREARILVANSNFGCGSAREQAVYALGDFGIKAVIAPSFGEIFRVNCGRNGLIPATVPASVAQTLRVAAADNPGLLLMVDLVSRTIRWRDGAVSFDIDDALAEQLLSGRDEIDETLLHEARIAAYEAEGTVPAPETFGRG